MKEPFLRALARSKRLQIFDEDGEHSEVMSIGDGQGVVKFLRRCGK